MPDYLSLTSRISTGTIFLMLVIIFLAGGAYLWASGQVSSSHLPTTSQPAIHPAAVDSLSKPQLLPPHTSIHRGVSSSKANLVVIGQESDCLDIGKSITLFCFIRETQANDKP